MALKYNNQGQVLMEILIALFLMGIVATMVITSGFLGFRSTKTGGSQTTMLSLAQEGTEAFEAIARSNWHGVYNLAGKSTTEYYPFVDSGAWSATTTLSYKTVTVDGVPYSRWVIIDNASRTSGYIDSMYIASNDDPSTQKITVNVTSTGYPDVQLVSYLIRSRNTKAFQTDWSGGCAQATNPNTGFDADFNSQCASNTDGDLTSTAGSIKILAQ